MRRAGGAGVRAALPALSRRGGRGLGGDGGNRGRRFARWRSLEFRAAAGAGRFHDGSGRRWRLAGRGRQRRHAAWRRASLRAQPDRRLVAAAGGFDHAQPEAAQPRPPGARREQRPRELWPQRRRREDGWQWPEERAEGRRWAAPSAAAERSCAVPGGPERRPEPRRSSGQPRRGSRRRAAWLQAVPPALPAYARDAPLLPLPSSWPEWPSSHRRAWRCATDRSWERWLAGMARRTRRSHARQARDSCAKCARTFSASSPSSELECVLPASHAEFRKNVENRARLDFQLFREIVDTNLAHPPLFNSVPPKRP